MMKISKEDTWRSDDLKVHIQGHNEESRRKERSKQDGESLDRQQRDPDRDARREKEKHRDREGSKHRDPEKDRHQDNRTQEDREHQYKEKRRERENRHRDEDKEREEKKRNRGEKERGRDREKERYKEQDIEMYKQQDRDTERDREKDRERRRTERDRERRSERDKRNEEKAEVKDLGERLRDKEREREERRERHKARENDHRQHKYEEKHRDGERRERHGDKEHKEREHRRDREDKERRRRDKESYEADRRHSQEAGIKDGDRDREKASEREERHRRRDKRHKETSESKRHDSERKHKESSGHEQNERTIIDKEVKNVQTEQDKQSSKDYHNDYEEDFEDYEEDFEDVDDEEEEKGIIHDDTVKEDTELSPRRREDIEAIQRAIHEENERIYSTRSKPTITASSVTERESLFNSGPKHGKIIDFVSAKQREVSLKVAKKQKKRSEELLRLIDLDFSITFSLLDLPPVNEYDMYIKNFGTANTKQAYVQCNEDNTDRDIQTEEVDMTDKWTQHPPESKAACGGSEVSQETADESTARMTFDSQRLTTFLRSATQVMAVLIEENNAESNSLRRLRSQTDAFSFSDGCLQLNTRLPFLHGRQVSLLQFSQVQRQTLLSVHPPASKTSAVRMDNETVICVWNMWEPSRPQKILLNESEVKCCCFSPGKAALVFAGTAVGSVGVWDLREHSGTHNNLVVGTEEWTLRYPTFSTDCVLSGMGHLSPVVSVEPMLTTTETSLKSLITADIEESLGMSFQLASLDENGLLALWVVVELPKGNYSGSQTDLGLRPGGKVKLLHSSSIQTTERLSQDIMTCGPPASLQLKFLPSDSSHYFIGTNMGLVRHGTRHRLKVLPKYYRSQFDSCRPVEVTTLDFSPSGEPLFLAGCSDGTLRLHSVLKDDPLMEWTCSGGPPILSVQWSQTRPAVFFVLDAASDLHIWDLTKNDYVPVITENIHNDRVTVMAVFGEPAKQNTFSGVALAKQSGTVEIQYFTRSLTVPNDSDKEKLNSVWQDLF
ncbi:cytoplasmic dynein 2 intermediate chain 1 isoform X2 [Triplophysa rosa]|uniref:cytoplasmic dynein 2 intermediate chain 1 isoform X2 n=1 Tax=Triplophysa rosa TaxID=992332 RepID=UPI002545C6D3|nr:cytoplasmic dynein 2 intermediate chain 1 isoform X2 [Triplophysa rosa]